MEEKRIYKEVADFDFNRVEEELNSQEVDKIVDGILSTVFDSGNYELSLQTVLRFVEHPEERVRAISRLSFGHMARIFRRLELEKALPHLITGLEENGSAVEFQSEIALKDISVFIRFDSYDGKQELKSVKSIEASQVIIALYKIIAHETDFSVIKKACCLGFKHSSKAVRLVSTFGTWRMSGQILEKELLHTITTIKRGLKINDPYVQENLAVAVSTLRYVVETIEQELKIKKKDIA